MKQSVQFAMRNKIIAVFCVLVVLTGLFTISLQVNSQSADASNSAKQISNDETSAEIVNSKTQGSESLTRHGGFRIPANGDKAQAAGSARVAAAADFNGDGIGDVIVAENDRMILRLGDINAFAPQTEAAAQALRDGLFVSPFKQKVRATGVPVAADFVFAGDFNRDTHLDAAFAARGDNSLYVLEGDGRGNFPNLRRIEIGGAITTLAAGDVNRADGLPDLIVGVNDGDGAKLQIFAGLGDIFIAAPQIRSLPASAESIAVGQLNEDEFADIAVAARNEIIVLSGADANLTDAPSSAQMLRLQQSANIKSLVVGDFLPDRDNRAEIAFLTAEGGVQILQRGVLDTAPVSRQEHLAEQVREYRAKGYPVPQRILQQLSQKDLLEPAARRKLDLQTWAAADNFFAAVPNSVASPEMVLTAGRVSRNAAEDLIVLDSAANRALVMPFEAAPVNENIQRNFTGKRQIVEFNAENQPIAVLPMRLNSDGEVDLLFVEQNQADFVAIVSAPTAIFTVNSNLDTPDANLADNVCQTSVAGQCTLRAAIMQANRTAGNDTININASIGTITINSGQPDNDTLGTNNPATGDLDITCAINVNGDCNTPLSGNVNDLTINGAAGGSVIAAGTFTPYSTNNGNITTDRVFDIGQDGVFGGGFGGSTGIHVTMTNLTIQNGNVRELTGDPNGGGNYAFGGAIRFDGFGNGFGALTLTSCTINNNQADNAGGGVYQIYGTFNTTGSTYSTNITKAGEGGGLFFGAATSNSNVNISGSTFISNEARQGIVFGIPTTNADGGAVRFAAGSNTVTIGTTNFTNNIAQEDGGAVKALNSLATITGGTMSGNTARRNGGAVFGDIDTAGTSQFLTVSGSTVQNNTANSDNSNGGDGGGIYRDRGTQNITGATIGGTSAGQPNTATNGGGVAQAFTVDSAAGNTSNQSTVNINGGSIAGNVANTDGGGIYFNSALFDVAATTLNVGATTATSITGNKAKNNGGGIVVINSAAANLTNMTLTSNQANSDNSGGGDGGALYQNTGTTTFLGTLAVGGSGLGNSAVNGGGIRNASGTVTLPTSASVTFNTATGDGGGISNAGTLSNLTSPNISGNSAANGAGIAQSGNAFTISGATINNNTATGTGGGIYITANQIDITGSTISGNTKEGIRITGGTGSSFNGSNIFNNSSGLGIDLGAIGVTANDANDADSGANNLQNFPVLNYVKSTGEANVTLNSTASRNFRIDYFANTACDASGNGEGETFLSTQNVTTNTSGTITYNSAALSFGAKRIITATATDLTTGDTSEFSQCRTVNTPPTISAASGVTRQQGSPISNSQIATVGDVDQAANTLTVTVNGGASATVNGVTVSGIAIDAAGNVTANIIATCGATNATFTLRATDNATEFNEATLSVAVTANTAPTVGNYANTTVNAGSNITVTPDAAPIDNGSIASVTAAAAPAGFTGTFSTNTATGAITVTNAAPAGTYTITVTTTDNCGLATTKTFTLTVNAIPTIAAQSGVTRQQGSAATNSQIATVNDNDQTENTLVVTVNGAASATVSGVTISNIAVSAAGVVTADVVASCGAITTSGFTLRVTDTNGAFTETALTVTVTANSAPTVGTYANTVLSVGGGTTVTPTAAPADNGSVATATAAAPGFTGTFSVNTSTGVVTIANANPAGVYTVTVTITDNCGTAATRQFTLTVNTPPTITAASGVTRRQANGTSNSQIATVNDADQTENTLVVTVNGASSATVNGVTISNIAVSAAGVVTADIIATAIATDASFTLRVTDNQNSFAEATLTVVVTPASYEADVSSRPSGDTFIDASDIQQIRNFSVGLDLPYQNNEFQRADCAPRTASGDGFVDSDDVQQARRYSVGTDAKQSAAGALSRPISLMQPDTTDLLIYPLLNKETVKKASVAAATPAFRIDNQNTSAGQMITIPIRVDTAGNEAGYTFSVSYDQTRLTNPQVAIGTAGGDVISNALTAGQIGFSVTSFNGGTIVAGTNLLLVNVTFTVAANAPAGTTTLSFTDTPARRKASGVDPNTPIQQPTYTSGTVTIAVPTAAEASINGRVMTRDGRGISGAVLTITAQTGASQAVRTNPSGYYRVENIAAGETYIISVTAKNYTFAPQIVNLNEDLNDFNFTTLQ